MKENLGKRHMLYHTLLIHVDGNLSNSTIWKSNHPAELTEWMRTKWRQPNSPNTKYHQSLYCLSSLIVCYEVWLFTLAEILITVWCRSPAPPEPQNVFCESGTRGSNEHTSHSTNCLIQHGFHLQYNKITKIIRIITNKFSNFLKKYFFQKPNNNIYAC